MAAGLMASATRSGVMAGGTVGVLTQDKAQEKTKNYEMKEADLALSYPASWKLSHTKYADIFEFPIKGQTVLVRMLHTDQRSTADEWQSAVKMIEETNGNSVQKQWEEELLGVPLLMTRYLEQKGAVRSIVLVGLLYSKTPEKASFRVIAPEPVAEDAEAEWRKVLVTARTVSGKLPTKEQPGTAPPAQIEDPVKEKPGRTVIIGPVSRVPKEPFKGPARFTANADRGLYAYLPEGWSMDKGKISNADGFADLKVTFSLGDFDAAKTAWLKDCGAMMSEMKTINERLEPPTKMSLAGFTLTEMTRTGTNDKGPYVQNVILGWSGGLSWTLTYSGSAEEWAKVKDKVHFLADRLSVASS